MKNIIKKSFVCVFAALATLVASAFDTPYLTFRSATQFTISATKYWDGTIQKATSNPTEESSWSDWTGTSITAVQTGGQYYIYLRGKNNTIIRGNNYASWSFMGSNISCDGDIETLRDYEGNPPAMGAYCYRYMFSGCTALIKAPTLSATTLADYCYQGMFQNCSNLTSAPELPATSLAQYCYNNMFSGCSSLMAAPELPATTLANNCYSYMFQNCTSIKTLPALPATTLPTSCYSSMFNGCTSLEVNTVAPGAEWSIPAGATGTVPAMFGDTSGLFTGAPVKGTTYYVASALPAGEIYQVGGSGTLDLGLVGFSYSRDLTSTVKNGTAPYTFTHVGGTLPPGLTPSGSTLSGTPTTAGNYAFTLSVTDSESHVFSSASYTLKVVQPTIVNTSYVMPNGSGANANCIRLTTDMTTLNQEWYVVDSALNFGTGGIKVSGNVNLVLADDASLTVQGAAKKAGINVAIGNSLTIYGQTGGTGSLTASGYSSDGFDYGGAGIGGNDKESCGTITINGGTVTATGSQYTGAGIGGGKSGNGGIVTINGGTVIATGGTWYGSGIGGGQSGNGGTVTINGGTVTATAGSSSEGTTTGATGIGKGQGYSPTKGTLTVGATMSVKAGSSANPTTEIGRGGSVTIGTYRYYYIENAGLEQIENEFSAYAGETKNWNLADTIDGGTPSYTFTPVSGYEPPSGLELSGTTLSGSVAAAGTYTIKYTVTDSSATPLELEAVYTLTVIAPDPLSASTNLGTVKVGKAKDFNLSDTISGGVPPYVFTSTGSLPAGFSLSGSTLSFTAAAAGNYACEITVTDQLGTTLSPSPVYTVEAIESAGFTDDDPDEPDSGVTVNCLTPDGVFPRTCNQVASSSTSVTWENSWYYVTGDVTLSKGVTVVGKVSLVLGDGATLTVTGSGYPDYLAGITVTNENVLTIYAQSEGDGAGRINASGSTSYVAGIGGGNGGHAGTINIYGGNITATGGFFAAAIGGGQNGNGGTVTINGGTVSATGYFSPGIGAGNNGTGGTITVNGGTVTAAGYSNSSYPGVGANGSYEQGTLTVGSNIKVKAGDSTPLTDANVITADGSGNISLATKHLYYEFTTIGPEPLTQTTSAFAAQIGVAFEQSITGTISGGTAPYTFTLKSQTLSEKGLSYSDGVISGTPSATGSATVTVTVSDSATGVDHQSEDFTYTVTVTYPPKSITYVDSRDGTTELTGLVPAQYTPGTGATLPATATAPTGYNFAGWYVDASCTGDAVTSVATTETEDKTYYAKWTPILYTITYRDGASTMSGLVPTTYTIESADITLPTTATKDGYEFVAWYANSTFTGSPVTSIPAGTTGNKTFYARWIKAKSNESYIDADGNPQTELASQIESTTTSLESGWYIVKGNVAINSTLTVSGDVKLILADGANLTVTPSNSDNAGINVAAGNSLSIYIQSDGTGSLTATAIQTGNGAGIGGNKNEACGSVAIYGGNVTATGGFYGAGIGGGRNGAGGTVAIYGGTVTATGVYYGAGIGGGYYGAGGTITIEGGTVTATSSNSGAGIGGGNYGAGGTVTISGGAVTATGGSSTSSISGYIASGIGKGYGSSTSYANGTLTVGANMKAYAGSSANPTAELGSNRSYRYYVVKAAPLAQTVSDIEANAGEACNINLADTVVGGSGTYTFALKAGSELPSDVEIVDGTTLAGTVAAVGTYEFTLVVTDTTSPTPQTIDAAYTLKVKLPGYIEDDPAEPASGIEVDCRTADGKVRRRMCNQVVSSSTAVTWDNSWYYVTGDVTLSAGVTVNGKVSLVLADDATLTVTGGSSSVAGINVVIANSVTNSLTIYGQDKGNGSLTATAGGDNGAGIGGGNSQKGGKVNVYGGSIKATGGYYGSGIGGGRSGAGGVVSVYGGAVNATGGYYGSGIGGGYYAAGSTVNFYGGTIEATAGSASYAIGIGRGGGSSSYLSGNFYVFDEDAVVRAGSSSTGSLTTLTPNATTHKVTVSTYKYFIVTGPLPMSQKTSSLGTALTGQQKSWTLSTSTYIVDGKAPYTFDPENSTIPEGFSLTTAGVLSGRPSAAGSYEFDVAVTDSNPSSTNFTFTLTVNDPNPITVATTDYGSITKGTSFYHTIQPTGGVSPYTFSAVQAELPPGITCYTEAGVGVLSGTCNTPGDYEFTVTVTDAALPANVQPIAFHLEIKDVYPITYYDEGGVETLSLNPATYVQDAGLATLPTPVKEGSAFLNWYDNAGLHGAPVTSIPSTSTGPVALYSKWYTPVSGDIEVTFNGADGEQTETCTVITPSMATYDSSLHYNNTSSSMTLSSGWYVVANIDTLPEKTSIIINGEVNIVLMDDRSLTLPKPANHKSGNWMSGIVLLPGNTLNIYGQTKGNGTLTATGFNSSAGIGGYDYSTNKACGTLKIYGGTVVANGGSGAAGIGGSASADGAGGTVEIYGGTVTATGSNGGAGIGSGGNLLTNGIAADGGTVTITGGTVTATGSAFSLSGPRVGAGAGIGGGGGAGKGGNGGTVEISNGVVTAIGGSNDDATAAGIGGGNGADSEGTLKVSGQYAVVYAGDDASSATERTPGVNDMVALDGSPYYEIQGEGAAPVTYSITYMSAGVPQTWLEPNQYTHGFAQELATPDPREGYTFDGWFDNDQFEGEEVTEIPASATGDKTFYAKWTPVNYTITYKNVEGEEVTVIDGLSPVKYTIESGATLPTEISLVKEGWVFDGWSSYTTGPKVTAIPAGTTGNKTFYVRWDVADFGLFDGELYPADAGVEDEWDLTGTIHKGTEPYTFALKDEPGNVLPDGLTLNSDGTLSGSVAVAGEYVFTITVTDSSEPKKTIDAEYTMLVCFRKRASGASGEDANLLIGHPMATMNLSTYLSGGTGPYTFEWLYGSLPSGLKLNGSRLEGTPAEKGNFYFGLEATDARGVTTPVDYWIYVGSNTLQEHFEINGIDWYWVSAAPPKKSSRISIYNGGARVIPVATEGCVYVPSRIGNLTDKITCLGAGAFSNCTAITRVTLPETIIDIGANAFYNCASLEKIVIRSDVENINEGAFNGCSNLSVVYVDQGDATRMRNLFEASGCDVSGITFVECVFYNLTLDVNLGTEFWMPVLTKPYTESSYLPTVGNLPVPVRNHYTFDGWYTKKFDGIRINEDDTLSGGDWTLYAHWTTTLDAPVFSIDNDYHGDSVLQYITLNRNAEVTLPDGVVAIGGSAKTANGGHVFTNSYDRSVIQRVTMPSSVKRIRSSAFSDCDNLAEVYLSSSLTNIGLSAFARCGNLKSIDIPGTVDLIDMFAFSWCSNLVELVIGDGVREIGESAFYGCTSLEGNGEEGLVIPDSVKIIGEGAFMSTGIRRLTIPKGAEVKDWAFAWCDNLEYVNIGGEILRSSPKKLLAKGRRLSASPSNPDAITIGSNAFSGNKTLQAITIGSTVEEIGGGAFSGCPKLSTITLQDNDSFTADKGMILTKDGSTLISVYGNNASLTVPSGVTTIQAGAFAGDETLTSVVLPNTVTTIGEAAFSNCTALTSVTIPTSETVIDSRAFYNTQLKTVYLSSSSDAAAIRVSISTSGYNTDAVDFIAPTEAIATLPSREWVAENLGDVENEEDIRAALLESADNGLPNWQNYVLGQDSDKPLSVAPATSAPATPKVVTLGTTFSAPQSTTTGFNVTYKIEMTDAASGVATTNDNAAATVNLESALATTNSASYEMKMTVVMESLNSVITQTVEKTVGVMKVESTADYTIVAVPWSSLGEGDIKVNELLYTGNRSEGDMLYAYDKVNKDYAAGTWILNAAKEWEAVNNYQGDNLVSSDPSMTIKRGQAVWIMRVNTSEPIYLLGQVSEETASVDLEEGTAETPSWNLVASPDAEDLDVTTISVDGADNDQIIVPTAGAPVNYTVKGKMWGYWKPEKGDGGIVRKVWTTEDIKIPAGQGFWYLNSGSSKDLSL